MLCRANFIVRRRLKLFAAIFDGFFAKPAGSPAHFFVAAFKWL
jgi:hypothetical protein